MNCQTCKFCNIINDQEGECRRYAPKLIYNTKDNMPQWFFPGVSLQLTWCGEYKEKE